MEVIGDHFTEEPIEEISLEWDCSADTLYDITCHGNDVDGFYWADVGKMHYPISPGLSFGDIGQNPFTHNLAQDQYSSSQRTIWVPFKENMPQRENSDDFLSASSSSTDYFSCFDSDSDYENKNEWRHFDADFSNLNLCLNVSVSHKDKDPKIVIATKAEKKKQLPSESSRWTSEEIERGDMLYDTTVLPSSLHACASDDDFDFSRMQSMVNKQNNKSIMWYRLVHIPDMEETLDDEFPKSAIEKTSEVLRDEVLEWRHFPIVAASNVSQMSTKEQVNTTFDSVNEDTGVKHGVLKEKQAEVKPVKDGSPSIQGDSREKNTKWKPNVKEEMTPVERVCLTIARTQENVRCHYSSVQLEKNKNKQSRIVHSKGKSMPKNKQGDDLLESQRKPDVEVQTGDGHGFMDGEEMRDENVTKHTREEMGGTVVKYTQNYRSKWRQENAQKPHPELVNVPKISELLQRIERICDGTMVHKQKYTVHERQCNMSTGRFSFFPGNDMENSSLPPERVHFKTTPMISKTSGEYKVKKTESQSIPSSKERDSVASGEDWDESPGYKHRNKEQKLQYKSNKCTITVEYCHTQTTNKNTSPTNKQHEQEQSFKIPHQSYENHKPLPISKYSKTIVEDGRIVYKNIKSWGTQSKVEKVYEFSEGSRSEIPRITYRMSEGVPTSQNQRSTKVRKDDGSVQASSCMKGESGRFDLNRYIKKRGGNTMTRNNNERNVSEESYYHTAKMLSIRVVANAKLDISRDSLEQDDVKQRSVNSVLPVKTTLAPCTGGHSNTFHDKVHRNPPKELPQIHSRKISQRTKCQSEWDGKEEPAESHRKWDRTEKPTENVESSDKYLSEKRQEKDYRGFESTQNQRRPRVWREEAVRRNGYFPNSPIDVKRKHVHFDV